MRFLLTWTLYLLVTWGTSARCSIRLVAFPRRALARLLFHVYLVTAMTLPQLSHLRSILWCEVLPVIRLAHAFVTHVTLIKPTWILRVSVKHRIDSELRTATLCLDKQRAVCWNEHSRNVWLIKITAIDHWQLFQRYILDWINATVSSYLHHVHYLITWIVFIYVCD